MKKIGLLLALSFLGCTDEAASRRALEQEGYTDISFTGYDWFACAKDDTFHTGFRAKGPTGKPASGVVCCGLMMKGCTVRH